MKPYVDAIVALLEPLTGLPAEQIAGMIAPSPKPEMGDLGFPCFTLAKSLRMSPPAIAEDLAAKVGGHERFSRIAAVGPYLNFTINSALLVREVLSEVRHGERPYGGSTLGAGKTVIIDFSSPNIAKPLAIHHIRSTIIGAALTRIYRLMGYRVIGLNHLGDWGTNFGQLMVSYKREEEKNPGQEVDIHRLLQMYIQFHRDAHEDESLNDDAKAWFVRLEQNDPEAIRLWTLFCEESLRFFKMLYARLGVEFDEYIGESHYNNLMADTLRRISERGLSSMSDGALVVSLGDDIPPCLLRKKDGSTLYATRDLSAAEYRFERWKFEECLYVVANQQELHFRQVFEVLERMGYAWARGCEHIKFGMLSFGEGVFADAMGERVTGSTRKGRIVFLEEVLDRAREKAREMILANARDEEVKTQIDELAETIGVGAIVFNELSQRRVKDVVFTWERALNLHGDSGPYLQYTHARLSSVIRRFERSIPAAIDFSPLVTPPEIEVVKAIARFPSTVERACREREPSIISDYLLELASVFNRFFTDKANNRIISEDEALTLARVGLVDSVRRVLAIGLALLGLKAPERM